jgi:hypothetical protein
MHLLQDEIRTEQHEAVAAATDAVGQVGAAVEGVGRMVEVLSNEEGEPRPDAPAEIAGS